MEEKDGKIILDLNDDYEFCSLIYHILKFRFGEIVIEIKDYKPYRCIKRHESILLIKSQGGKLDKKIGKLSKDSMKT